MKVTQEKLPASQIGLEIEIPPEMSQKAYEKALQDFTRSANIPGFRKGKVPRQVLIQRFGVSRIKAAVIEDLIEDSLKQVVEQENIEAIGTFELRSSFEELVSQFEPGSALTFFAAVDVPPEVKLNQYRGLQVQAEEIKYDPEQVDRVLENYRSQSATLVPVEGRSAQLGDVAVVDFVGRVVDSEEQGGSKEILGGRAEDFQVDLDEGKFIPGFIDGMIGMNSGETREVAVTFPEDYAQEDLMGKPAVFTITLKELKERELPELDDDFAEEVSDFETLTELRESLETRFQKEAEQKTKTNKEQALLEELVKHVETEIPETLTQREADYMLTQTTMQLSQQGLDVKQMFTRDVIEKLRERSRPEAIIRIKRSLALGEVAKRESLQVEPEAIAARIKELMEDYEGEDIDPERMRQVVEEDLLKEKILSWLEEHANVELLPEGSLEKTEEKTEAVAELEPEAESKPEFEVDPATAIVETIAETVEADPIQDAAAEVVDLDEAIAQSSQEPQSAKPEAEREE